MVDELIFQIEDAEKLGLHSEALYVIEYDLNSRRLIPKDYKICPQCNSHTDVKANNCQRCGTNIIGEEVHAGVSATEKEEMERYNKVANEIRNKLFFALKFQIKATKHLESSWLVSKERLKDAVAQI